MPDSSEVLPCGCRMYTVGNTFVFEPHAEDCVYYRFVLEEAQRQDVTVSTLDLGSS